jgi:UDP-N-acetylglucosamine 2-epimerase (non-hydrolysing)
MTVRAAVVVGTRPEAIKMAPVIRRLEAAPGFETLVIATGQHREMLDQVFNLFAVRPDVDLALMQPDQGLGNLAARALGALDEAFARWSPDVVLVQGDTTTAFAAALAAFYQGLPVAHVEAGLRSHDPRLPFPEEMNRRLISRLAGLHFAPTPGAATNLLAEGVCADSILVTGNTIVDALQSVDLGNGFDDPALERVPFGDEVTVLLTAHRRESFGPALRDICRAARWLARERGVQVIYPVHPNPQVRRVVDEELADHDGVVLVAPLSYGDLLRVLTRVHLVLTDSGGIQEEAPSFHTPVLVLRSTTERPEVLECGAARLVGTSTKVICAEAERLLDDESHYRSMANAVNPFGDGHASERIVNALPNWLTVELTQGTSSAWAFDRVS